MPHIIAEYSDNLKNIDFQGLFYSIHQALASLTDIQTCKSRAVELNNYYIGNGEKNSAIFALTIKLMPGRDQQKKDKLAADISNILKQEIIPLLKQQQLSCQPSIEIIDIQHYTKL